MNFKLCVLHLFMLQIRGRIYFNRGQFQSQDLLKEPFSQGKKKKIKKKNSAL